MVFAGLNSGGVAANHVKSSERGELEDHDMGRVNQAMQRARQAGLMTEFQSIAVGGYDASVLAAEPFPAEAVQEPAAPDAPKTNAVSRHDDREIQEIFFNMYP